VYLYGLTRNLFEPAVLFWRFHFKLFFEGEAREALLSNFITIELNLLYNIKDGLKGLSMILWDLN
jgi:hypothetical protein